MPKTKIKTRPTKEEQAIRDARAEELKPEILSLDTDLGRSNKKIAEALNNRNTLNLAGKPWKDSDVCNFKARYLSTKPATTDTSAHTTAPEAQKPLDQPQEKDTSGGIPAMESPSTGTPESDNRVTPDPDHKTQADVDTEAATLETLIDAATRGAIADSMAQGSATSESIADTTALKLTPDVIELLTTAHATGELSELLAWWHDTRGEGKTPMPEKRHTLKAPGSKGKINTGLLIDQGIKDAALAAARKDPAITGGSLSLLVELLLWRFLGSPGDYIVIDE
jgi:hypothetical protein